jgi:hypothetical protein
MTPLPSSRVPLQLETTPNTKPACSAAEIRGRTAFWLLIGRSGALCKSSFWEISIDRLLFRSIDFGQIFDRSNFKFDRSTLSGSPNFQLFLYEICHSSLIVLQKQKTQKLVKTLENNKAKGLTNANQGVQIHHIWHSFSDNNWSVVALWATAEPALPCRDTIAYYTVPCAAIAGWPVYSCDGTAETPF